MSDKIYKYAIKTESVFFTVHGNFMDISENKVVIYLRPPDGKGWEAVFSAINYEYVHQLPDADN